MPGLLSNPSGLRGGTNETAGGKKAAEDVKGKDDKKDGTKAGGNPGESRPAGNGTRAVGGNYTEPATGGAKTDVKNGTRSSLIPLVPGK